MNWLVVDPVPGLNSEANDQTSQYIRRRAQKGTIAP